MFEVVRVETISVNGRKPFPPTYQVKAPNGKILFGFPDLGTAQHMCEGLNASIQAALDISTQSLVKSAEDALGVLEDYPHVRVLDYRRAATKLAMAVRPFIDCV